MQDFHCRRCGNCCRGPGDVILLPDEVDALAGLLGVSALEFTSRCTRLSADRRALSLSERADGACVFLLPDNTCRVQAAKPLQCLNYPHAWRTARLTACCAGLNGT